MTNPKNEGKNNTKFSNHVYQLVKEIPRGKVTTYKIIAEKLNTKAYRAVGTTLNKNLHWPEVPCHRVVGSNGSLVGFNKGIKEKKRLLEKEGIKIKNGKIVDLQKNLITFSDEYTKQQQ